jgi:Protein of unknown function (DUF2971)
MEKIPFVKAGTYLFRFMDHRTEYFWSAINDMLSDRLLFLNSRTRFNDPYDSHPIIESDLSTSAIRSYWDEIIQNPSNPNRSLTSAARFQNLKTMGRAHLTKEMVKNIKAEMRQATEDFLNSAGLQSFSLTAENPLLWGHYAASFAGVCVIFRRSTSMNSCLSMCANVSYVDRRPHLPMSLFHNMTIRMMSSQAHELLANEIFFLSFLHKSNHWGYEQEARIFYPLSASKKCSFDGAELVGFIVGPRSGHELERKLKAEITARRPSAALHRASLSTTDFRIVIPHKFAQDLS